VLVLQERDRETGFLTGLTSNYVEVLFGGPADLAGGSPGSGSPRGTDRTFGCWRKQTREGKAAEAMTNGSR